MEMIVMYRGIDLNCIFEIEPYVDAVLYGENSHPAEGGYIYDLEIYIEGIEISELLSGAQIENIEELIIDKL